MTLLNVERIKLFSTRSPYWCLIAIAVAALGFATLFGLVDEGRAAIPYLILRGTNLGMSIYMVLAALAVTTEYRFGTIKNSFLAVPKRPAVLAAKTLLLALIGLVVGTVAALAAFFLAKALATAPLVPLELSSADDWREVAGYGPLFAIAAVIAVSVGTIVRQSAGAVAILLLWPLLVESLFALIPTVGEKAGPWLPFTAADRWVSPTSSVSDLFQSSNTGPTPVQGLLVFAGAALLLWLIALVLLQKRDAYVSDLHARFGSARHPERAVAHQRPAATDDATVDAVGKISAAFEVVENARGMLYAFHRMSGEADLALQDGLTALRDAGQHALADEIDDVLVGRDVVRDMWTFQIVEAYDEQYWQVFQAVERLVRDQLSGGAPHVYEAEMKQREQTGGAN